MIGMVSDRERFERAFALLKVHEGGYSNHKDDPGGATMRGVTQRTFNAYRRRRGEPLVDVRNITDAEVRDIYKRQYWDAINADDLPPGVAYTVFDAGVNSGPGQAVRWLQRLVGVRDDGIVGDETIAATQAHAAAPLIDDYNDNRLAFMRSLRHWNTFKSGWTRRVAEVREQSKEWTEAGDVVTVTTEPPQPKAEGKRSMSASARSIIKDKPAMVAAGGGVLSGITPFANGDGPVHYALAAVLVIAVVSAVWFLYREHDAQTR